MAKGPCQCLGLKSHQATVHACVTIYLIVTPFNTFASRADPDQAALVLPDLGLLYLHKEI